MLYHAKTSGMPTVFLGAKTSAVEVTANLGELYREIKNHAFFCPRQ
jgi:hypothetical protein